MSGLSVAARSFIVNSRNVPSFEFGGKHNRMEPTEEALEGMLRMVEYGVYYASEPEGKAGAIRLTRGSGQMPKSELTYDGREMHELVRTAPASQWKLREKSEKPLTIEMFRDMLEERREDIGSAPSP